MKHRSNSKFRITDDLNTGNSSGGVQRGFTIVEVMIAVAVMSLMLVAILQVLSSVRLTRDRIHNQQETQLAGPIIMDQISQDLRGIHVLGRAKADHFRVTDRVQYGLDADRIDFITTSASREPVWIEGQVRRAQVCEVSYVTRPNQEDDEFLELYRREDFGVDDEPFKGGSYTFLSDRVKSFSIEVFEADGPDEQMLLDWANQNSTEPEHVGLPASVVISMTLENSPRLLREQIEYSSTQFMTVTYRRTVRFREELRLPEEELAFLALPTPPDSGGGEGDDGNEDEADRDNPGGGGGAGRGGGGGGGGGRGGGGGAGGGGGGVDPEVRGVGGGGGGAGRGTVKDG